MEVEWTVPLQELFSYKLIWLITGLVLIAVAALVFSFFFRRWRKLTRLAEAGVSSDLAKRLGGWTQDATVQRYDHADKTEEIRRALESTSS